jgi:hypothetical protein
MKSVEMMTKSPFISSYINVEIRRESQTIAWMFKRKVPIKFKDALSDDVAQCNMELWVDTMRAGVTTNKGLGGIHWGLYVFAPNPQYGPERPPTGA